MPPTFRSSSLLVVFVLGLPAFGADKDKPDPKDAASDKMVTSGQLTGTLRSVGSDKTISLQVSVSYVQPNPQAAANQIQQQMQMMQYQQQIMRAPPWQRPQLMMQMMSMMRQGQGSGVQVRQMTQDVDLVPADDMKVRVLQPPAAFDDKGNPKRYSAKELKEMKGNSTLPGYAAELNSLQQGQTVQVFLGKPAAKPKVNKEKEKEKDKEALADDKPIVKLIVIVAEPRNAP